MHYPTLFLLPFVALLGRSAAAQAGDAPSLADEWMAAFAAAWSADDEAAVQNPMADDVVLLGREPLIGIDDVMGWARQQMTGSGAMALEPLYSAQRDAMAYQVGRWQLGPATGAHTFLWKQGEDGAWNIASMYILDDTGA